MDKSTLSNYGWVVIVTLVLAVMLALATPFGDYVAKGASNVIKTFANTSDEAIDEDNIQVQSQNWDEYLKADTDLENNHSKHIEKSNVETGYKSQITTEKSDNYLMAFYERDTAYVRVHNFMYWDMRDPETNNYPDDDKYPVWKAVFEDSYDSSFNVMQLPFDHTELPLIEINSKTAIDISAAQDKSVIGYVTGEGNTLTFHIAGKDGVVMASEDTSGLFIGCDLNEINFNNNFNTSELVYATEMFDTNDLKELDLSSWDLSNLKDAQSMFASNRNLEKIILPALTSGSLERMDFMFNSCRKLEYLDLTNFNTENVTSFNHCFYDCQGLKAIDLTTFDTKSATTFQRMFAYCPLLTNIYVSDKCIVDATDNVWETFRDCGTNELTYV